MKIESIQVGQKLTVTLEDISDKNAIIETIGSCADGHCACSTDEYQKVQTLEILPGPDSIQLNIEVKPGEVIDPACISECLDPQEKN